MSEQENINISKCEICGITRLNNVFYWSNNGKSATDNEVYSKVCKIAKEKGRTEKEKCINNSGCYVKGLSWGESLEHKIIMNFFDDLSNEQNLQKESH